MRLRLLLFRVIILLCPPLLLSAESHRRVYSFENIPNVQLHDSTQFVSDPEGYLSHSVCRRIDEKLMLLRRNRGVECVVVVVPHIGDAEIEDLALQLLRGWGVGSSKQHSGIVVLTAIEDHLFRIETGYGMEGILPDATAISIFDNYVKEAFSRERYDEGIERAVDAIIRTVDVEDFEVAERTDSPGQLLRQNFSSIWKILFWISLAFGMFFVLIALATLATRNNSKRGPYTLKQKDRAMWGWGLALLLISPPFAILLFLLYLAYFRPRIVKLSSRCPVCHRQSYRESPISAPEFSALVTPSQRCEQSLRSVLYGGAICRACGYRHVYKVAQPTSRYKRCPSCGTRAFYLAGKKGIAIKGVRYTRYFYRCYYCGHVSHEDIRNDSDGTGAFIVGAVLGSMLGRGWSSHGGGFRGGGFGGGSGGGGGATGRW